MVLSPRRVSQLGRAAVFKGLERDSGPEICASHRLSLYGVRVKLRPTKVSYKGTSTMRALASKAVWARQAAANAGYQLD
eukprot:9236739-Pyramimonas_sp.AAC.1